jgi:hypothetical protein
MFVILMKQRYGEITYETNDSRSLLNYILFNLIRGIIVLSREIKKRLVFAKSQASKIQKLFRDQNLLDTL